MANIMNLSTRKYQNVGQGIVINVSFTQQTVNTFLVTGDCMQLNLNILTSPQDICIDLGSVHS